MHVYLVYPKLQHNPRHAAWTQLLNAERDERKC